MRGPVSRSRPSSAGGLGSCARRRAGLQRELALGLAHRVVGRPNSAATSSASLQLEAAHLLLGRRLREGIVLTARQQAPEQAGELAGAGDDRDRVAAARLDALIEARDRAGLTDGRPARLTNA
jgi:hypothetical protein